MRELEALAGTGVPVFLDSGAFSEVEEQPNGPPVVVEPITDAEWDKRLAKYQRLAKVLGPQLYVVAPDLVGNQDQTLERMAKYSAVMREVRGRGAHILAPIQFGPIDPVAFYWKAAWALGFAPIPAFPLKKAALWKPADVEAFVAAIKPHHIHLLGMGAKSRKAEAYLEAIHNGNPATQVSQDSNLIAGAVERDKETGEGLRALTIEQDAVRDEQLEGWNGEIEDPEFGTSGDFTDEIATPSEWRDANGKRKRTFGPALRRRIASAAGLDADQTKAWLKDPDAFLQEPCRGEDSPPWHEHPVMAHEMETAWIDHRSKLLAPARKTEAIQRAFASHPAAGQVKAKKPRAA